MEKLCEVLDINLNELLSGERLPVKEYNKKAEENMMSLIQESSEKGKPAIQEILAFIMSGVAFVVFQRRLDRPEEIGPLIAVVVLSVFYGLLFSLCLLPIHMKLEKKLLDE